MDLAKNLDIIRRLSVEEIDDSPTIVAIGAQNTGKSTTLNRFAEINIFPSRRLGDPYHGALTCAQISVSTNPEPAWRAVFTHGDQTINGRFDNKEDLEKEVYSFLSKQQKESKYKTPSGLISETIYLEVYGPGLPSILFVDTPGITSADKIRSNATLEMSKKSIRGHKNTIVLFFLNAADDPQNSPAWFAANEAAGPVFVILTKPDCAPADGQGLYEIMQSGIKGIANSKIYTVKSPDTFATESDWSNDGEMRFFDTTNLSNLKKIRKEFSPRVGISNLRSVVISELINLYVRNVDTYKLKLSQKINKYKQDFANVGEPITNETRIKFYNTLVNTYCDNIEKYIRNCRFLCPSIDKPNGDDAVMFQIETTRKNLEIVLFNPSSVGSEMFRFDDIIVTKMAEYSKQFMNTNNIKVLVQGFIDTCRDKNVYQQPLNYKILESYVSGMVNSQFMFKTIATIRTKLYENTQLTEFLREKPEYIQNRTTLLNKINSLTQLLSLF